MRWTNSSRLLLGGTTVLALLMVQGISNNVPRAHDCQTDFAKRLPRKVERLANENANIERVTFQSDEEDKGFQPPTPNLEFVNGLRKTPVFDDRTAQPDGRTEQPAEPDLGEFHLEFGSEDKASVADTTGKAQYKPSFRRPSNWQVNPMFDQPINDSAVDDANVIEIRSKPVDVMAETVPEKTPATDVEHITPASRPVKSVFSQVTALAETSSQSPMTSGPQQVAAPNSRRSFGFPVAESAAQKAAHHIEYGKSLSRRGATFAARQEFYNALQLIAQAIDTQLSEPSFTKALSEALTAIREASDFYVADSEAQIGLNTVRVVETHSSNIVTVDEARSSTPIELMQKYYAFAEERLSLAGGHNVVSAEALYCLGKLHSVMSKHDPHADRLDAAKAMVYHRACMNCDPSNYRSANELGTLLARNGEMQEAKAMLKRSLLIRQTPHAWKNLAIIHKRIGEHELAELAHQEFAITSQVPLSNEVPTSIRWIDSARFNSTAPVEFHESTASRPDLPVPTAPAVAPTEPKSERLIDKVKKWF